MQTEFELGSFVFNLPRAVVSATLTLSTYIDVGVPALRLIDSSTKEHLWTLSSNLSQYLVTPDKRCTFFKGYSENEGLLEPLLSTGLVSLTGRSVDAEFVSFPEVKINTTDEVWEAFDKLCQHLSSQ
jgi:hypothetical protein